MGLGRTQIVTGVLAISFLMAAVNKAAYADINYSLGLIGEHTDNIYRSPVNVVSEWIVRSQAAVLWTADTGSFESDTTIGAIYQDYLNDTYDDRTDYLVSSALVWNILPQRFLFHFDDTFTRVQIDPSEPNTPNNQGDANVMSLGPTIHALTTDVDSLVFEGRYTDTYYEFIDRDSLGVSVGAIYRRQLTPALGALLEYYKDYLRYDNTSYSSELSDRVEAGYEKAVSPTTYYAIRAGKTRIRYLGTDREDIIRPTGRFDLSRSILTNSLLQLSVSRELSNSGQMLAADPELVGQSDTVLLGSTFFLSRTQLGFNRQMANDTQLISVWTSKIDYVDTPGLLLTDATSDQDIRGVGIELSHNFSRGWQGGISGSGTETEYTETFRTDKNTRADLWVLRQVHQNLSTRVTLSRGERDSTDLLQEYVENKVILAIIYNTGTPEQQRARRAR